MNPNSQNQWWSKWTVQVTGPQRLYDTRSAEEVRCNCQRFFRRVFGSSSAMRARHLGRNEWVFEIRTEGHPAHDPTYVGYHSSIVKRFFLVGFGVGTTVQVRATLEAGSAQDGAPAAQLLIVPSLIGVTSHG